MARPSSEVARMMELFVRTARAHRGEVNAERAPLLEELVGLLPMVLRTHRAIEITVSNNAFLLGSNPILQELALEDSIPHAFFRDGVRQITLQDGLTRAEIEILVEAAAHGARAGDITEDVVATLWGHPLNHVQLVIDHTFAPVVPPGTPSLKEQREALLQQSSPTPLGGLPDVASGVAAAIDAIPEMGPGLHPAKAILHPPRYAAELMQSIQLEDKRAATVRTANAAVEAFTGTLAREEADNLGEVLISMIDGSISDQDLAVAAHIVRSVRNAEGTRDGISQWLRGVATEERVGSVVLLMRDRPDTMNAALAFFRACGPMVVPALIGTIPQISVREDRRTLSRIALELGITDLSVLRSLIDDLDNQAPEEAFFMLGHLNTSEAQQVLTAAAKSKVPAIRAALLRAGSEMPNGLPESTVVGLLEDPDPAVSKAAAESLLRINPDLAKTALTSVINKPTFTSSSLEVKKTLLRTFAIVGKMDAFHPLQRFIKAADSKILSKKEVEDLGVAAVQAIAYIPVPRTIDLLKKTVASRNKHLAEAARATLVWLKEQRK